jgi:FAD/FMN-containing dehydrogenase
MELLESEIIPLTDWSGHTDFGRTERIVAPKSEDEVVGIVRRCRAGRLKLRVVGRRTSWNALWHCEDVMMSSNRLDAITEIDVPGRTVTCEPGVTLAELHRTLWEHGLTLDCSPAIDWVTVGGAISTGSHGSGNASISSRMIGCRLVTSAGEVVEIGEGDARLDAVRVSLGLLGVLTSIKLRVVPAFHVRLRRSRVIEADWKRCLTEGEMSYSLWFPNTATAAFVQVDVLSDPERARELMAAATREGQSSLQARSEHPQAPEGSPFRPESVKKAVCGLANFDPGTFPARNRYLLDVFFPPIEEVGPAHEILMSYRSDPIAGAEWSVPVSRFDAALAAMREEITEYDWFLPVVWLKQVRGETAWLSAADEQCVQCGIYHEVIEGTPSHVNDMVARAERIMIEHGGRPHLGKLIRMSPNELKGLYPRWEQFDALRRQMDPDGMFWTGAIEARFGHRDAAPKA